MRGEGGTSGFIRGEGVTEEGVVITGRGGVSPGMC